MGSSATAIVGKWRGNNVRVETITLEQIRDMYRLSRMDFIKMDIEGAETEVLKASADILKQFRPGLLIEAHWVGGGRPWTSAFKYSLPSATTTNLSRNPAIYR